MEALLKHLHASVRGADSSPAAFQLATAQLEVLGASAARQEGAADLAEELLERAEQLAGSKQASQRLLGVQLLRSAIEHCHRRTFLAQHTQWAALLLATLRSEQQRGQKQQGQQEQPEATAAAPSAVAAETCACLAAYFSRVGRMLEVPGVRRDGAAAAAKLAAQLVQQGQKQQQQQQKQQPALLAIPQGQAALLAALSALPASFRQQQKALEQAILPLLMSPTSPPGGPALLAACAAALPRIAGDGSSWSAFCQRLMLTAHKLADVLLLQLDDGQLAAAGRGALDPAAEPLPLLPAAGGSGALSSEAYTAGFAQLGAVLQALQQLLAASYPSAVPVPAGGLLLLVSRLLSADDAVGAGVAGSKAATAAAASTRFPQLCLQLPSLQAAALGLLQRMLAACGAAAAPYFLAAGRLLADALQRSAASSGGGVAHSAQVRCQLYSATRQLLAVAGIGAVKPLAATLIQAAEAELYGRKRQEAAAAAAAAAAGGEDGPARKKRKGKQAAAVAGMDGDVAAGAPLDDLGATGQQRDMAVQAAVLQALQTLCTTGAPLLPQQQRRQLDDMAAHVAVTTARAACQLSSDAESAVGATLAAVQLASHQLLLASLLAPAQHRPRHLAAALQLFRSGSSGGAAGGSVLAPFCRHALLCCEALLHPRALPPPTPLRRVLPAAAAHDDDAEGGGAAMLGMPRFWSSVDAALLLQQEQVQLAARQQQQQQQQQGEEQGEEPVQPAHEANGLAPLGGNQEMADAEAAEQGQQQQQKEQKELQAPSQLSPPSQPQQQVPLLPTAAVAQQAQRAPAVSSMAAMLAATPAVAPPAAPSAAVLGSPPLPAAAPTFAAPPAPLAAAPPAAAAAAAVAAAAAAEADSDSEGSLPEIDSGEGSSSSSSGSDSEGEQASG